ncbi:hypothetical protein ACFOYU_00195 [Microvirga sp. GCM10011540]|uniref:hypothetical protein n=1 Tax=Microvirga sp. GCM10011540 TaxID=3317338 RepID=UPI003616F90D
MSVGALTRRLSKIEQVVALKAASGSTVIDEKERAHFPTYAPRFLKIRTKTGAIEPFVFNRAQQYIHAKLEEQKAATGRVRALILKGRQQGCSTYVSGRFYHRVSHSVGLRCFILTHEDAATQNLFEMVNRYHEQVDEAVKPKTGAANAKELNFSDLDSGYKVGTAGTKGAGRSSTVQLFHGSEVAFWPNAESHAAGVLQAVPDMPGTEVILESTANGLGNYFHQSWRAAEMGQSEFIAIFVPWYWQDEYRKAVPEGFSLSEEEQEYQEAYGLDLEQMVWRRNKIAELKDPNLFKQEYPATAAEAFQMSGHDSYIPAPLIVRARKHVVSEAIGPLVIGFDPAWMGPDRSSMAWRKGRKLLKVESRSKLNAMEAAGWVKQVIDAEKPIKVFMDVGGIGAGIYDRLVEMGYSAIVEAVNFGSSPLEPQPRDETGKPKGGPVNRRAEMWMKSKEWLEDEGGVQIPDLDSLQADACGPTYKYDSLSRLQIEKKEDMRRRGVPSPDEWDAVALTFARPVNTTVYNMPKRDMRWLV